MNSQHFGREIAGWVVRFAFALCVPGEDQGLFESLVEGGLAFGAQGAEFGHVALDGAVDAPFIECEQLELVGRSQPGAGLRHGIVVGNVGRVGSVRGVGGGKFVVMAGGEEAGFDGGDADQAPAILGDGLGEAVFEGADGSEGFDNSGAVGLEGFLLFGGEDWVAGPVLMCWGLDFDGGGSALRLSI